MILICKWISFSIQLYLQVMSGNTSILESRGLNFDSYFYWISVAALFGFILLFNVVFTFALAFLKRKFIFC